MGDSWEDEDFEVPVIASAPTKKVWDDEEDEVEVEPDITTKPAQAQIDAAKKKAEKEEIALSNALQFALEEDLTPEERRRRERQKVEEADQEIASDLFSGSMKAKTEPKASASAGLGGIPLKTKQDHQNFGIICSKKLTDSTPIMIGAYYKSLSEKVKDKMTSETLDDVIALLTRVRDDKKKTEAAAAKKANATTKKSKKELLAEKKKHDDIFGPSDGGNHISDKYDHYQDMEDDFF